MAAGDGTVPHLRLLLVDACRPFRDGLRAAFERQVDLTVVADAGSITEALPLAAGVDFDVALVDTCLPDGSGIDLCYQVVAGHQHRRVLILSLFDWDVYMAGAWAAGAAGFLPKNIEPHVLALAARRCLTRQLYTAEQLRRIQSFQSAVGERLSKLAQREQQVLCLLAQGLTNRQMGKHLGLKEHTIEKHVSSLLEHMGARSRGALLSFVLRHRLDVTSERTESRESASKTWWVPVLMGAATDDNDPLTEP